MRAERHAIWERLAGEGELLALADRAACGEGVRFAVAGRTGWLPLPKSVTVALPGASLVLRSLKVKGVGLGGPGEPLRPPSPEPYLRANPHVGFGPGGGLRLVESAPAPRGGITLPRARREHDNALRLTEGGCPTVAPVALYELVDPPARFHDGDGDAPLGVVITASPLAGPERADERLDACRSADERVAATPMIAALGRSLRRFHELGLYRYSATLDNVAWDEASGQALLVDLDSSLVLAGERPPLRGLQQLRDVASAVFNLAAALMSARRGERFPLDLLARMQPFRRLLRGYYHDLPPAEVDRAAAAFEAWHAPVHARVIERLRGLGQGALEARRDAIRGLWMDRRRGYGLLLVSLRELHAALPGSPALPSRAELRERAAAFTGARISQSAPPVPPRYP